MRQIEAADAVVEEVHAHALLRFRDQRVFEHFAERIVAHDEKLHDHVTARLLDRVEDRVERRRPFTSVRTELPGRNGMPESSSANARRGGRALRPGGPSTKLACPIRGGCARVRNSSLSTRRLSTYPENLLRPEIDKGPA